MYLVLFIGGSFLAEWIPLLSQLKTIDSGGHSLAFSSLNPAISNILLLVTFGLQHSIMARPGFKEKLTKFIPASSERSIFVLITCLLLIWLYVAWQPMPHVIWDAENLALKLGLTALFLMGAGIVLWSTFMINHWELFGLSQAIRAYRGLPAAPAKLVEPALYKVSRHPLYLGILLVMWATPFMTTGHLILSAVWTAYLFIGIGYEERDLLAHFGDAYRDYMKRVPQLLPFGIRRDGH
ncbi:membrane protein [Kordiimonas sediminis]|uniref:Membrane protein n=1 Tax=Kordiimonas sediminis TaxID=1735581 RepID=A0A919AV81_9PROT|nr:isoprenylcysteine carboxylmethyltransferase family protein [Kordiimonas sediminis]GHF24786.1 membrane protein [Kordiimonas sediminis]